MTPFRKMGTNESLMAQAQPKTKLDTYRDRLMAKARDNKHPIYRVGYLDGVVDLINEIKNGGI